MCDVCAPQGWQDHAWHASALLLHYCRESHAHAWTQVLTTTNITEAIDLAFVDRADIKAYIGNPGLQARCRPCALACCRLSGAGYVPAHGSL